MTKIKFCGLFRDCDIDAVNELKPDYIGFVFAKKSKRYVMPEKAAELKKLLLPTIKAVGVFVDEPQENIVKLLTDGIIDIVQLHGKEDEDYIRTLRKLTAKPVIKAFCIDSETDIADIETSSADYVLLDSGKGTGNVFDWDLIMGLKRSYFLAGGLSPENVGNAVNLLSPYAVDVSSGIETDGFKDSNKMTAFAAAISNEERKKRL